MLLCFTSCINSVQDQCVELPFLDLLKRVREKRQLFMAHSTVIGAPPVDELASPPMILDNSDPMMLLMECISQKRLRISDLFTKLDKDQNQSLTKQEFTRGLQVSEALGFRAHQRDVLSK